MKENPPLHRAADATVVKGRVFKKGKAALLTVIAAAGVCEAFVTKKGKAMTDRVDRARERIGQSIFAKWDKSDVEELVRLTHKFSDDFKGYASTDPARVV